MADNYNAGYRWLSNKAHKARGLWLVTKCGTPEDKRLFARYERWTTVRDLYAAIFGRARFL